MKVVAVAGVRPQYIKLTALARAVEARAALRQGDVSLVTVNAGQHYSPGLSSALWEELGLVFDIDLSERYSTRDPLRLLGEMADALHETLPTVAANGDWVVAFGDANATLATALAAKRAGLRLAHVEAGARTGDKCSPEEQNAIAADHFADARFISSLPCRANLEREGLHDHCYWAGDLHYDLVRAWRAEIEGGCAGLSPDTYVLCAVHHARALENQRLLEALTSGEGSDGLTMVFVEHPRTREVLDRRGYRRGSNVVYVPPLSFREMLAAIMGARYVITDSGGLQREAYYLGRPSVTVGGAPFWPQLIDAGASVNVREPAHGALSKAMQWAADTVGKAPSSEENEFGDGRAGDRIVAELERI